MKSARTTIPDRETPARRSVQIEELSVGRAVRLFGRSLTLRCPHCGKDRLPAGWFKLKAKCGACGLRTDRGEEDFFLGGMMWNIVLAEGALLFASVLVGILTWPDVPWTVLQWSGTVLMVLVPFLFYPLSLCVWLASDILIRPVTEEEMRWHSDSAAGEFRSYRER